MANELNITISLTDRISTQLENTSANLQKFSQAAKHVGRELSQVGSTISMLGGAISGPFILALANSAKSSDAVSEQMNRLHSITNQFQTTIAESVVPVVERFNNILNGLLAAFNSLDPGMRTMILQGAFLAGIFLTMSGVMAFVIGKTFALASNVAGLASTFLKFAIANPMLLAIAANIGILIFLMFKFKGIADIVISTFEILFTFLQNGFYTIRMVFNHLVVGILDGLHVIISKLAQFKSPMQAALLALDNAILQSSIDARIFAEQDLIRIKENAEKIGHVMTTGEGDWSKTFDDMKTKAGEFFNTITEGNANILEDTTRLNQEIVKQEDELKFLRRQISDENFMRTSAAFQEQINALNFYKQEFMLAHQGMAAFVTTVGQSIQTNLSGAITNIVTGAKKAREAFAEFGQAMIKAIVQFMAQKLVAAVLEKTLLAGTVATSTAAAAAIAAAWAPAAAMVSLATLGGNAAPAAAGIASVNALSATMATVGSAASKIQGAAAMAEGGQGIVTRPTLFLAGEAGPERFSFTPIGAGGKGDGSGSIAVNIYIQSANLSSGQDIAMVGEELGIRTARSLKTARGI